HNGKAVRASTGSVFHLPVARERDLPTVLAALGGLTVLAADGHGELDLHSPAAAEVLARPTAWIFGGEAHGLPEIVLAAADHRVRVPLYGRAESLNLATAAAVCLYASAAGQRSRITDRA
uniref:TrmH family RNA methyltransferase n=1 Tax=Pseudonocardia pini TaxID=2758030 RepID=UPI0015EFFA08